MPVALHRHGAALGMPLQARGIAPANSDTTICEEAHKNGHRGAPWAKVRPREAEVTVSGPD
jgi:hypothetical protein